MEIEEKKEKKEGKKEGKNNNKNPVKTIGFHINAFSFRGTELATYDYADKNETILGNKSIIYAPRQYNPINHPTVIEKFTSRFPIILYSSEEELEELCSDIDLFYTLKYGRKSDPPNLKKTPMFVHCVYEMKEPHGKYYIGVSETVCENSGYDTKSVLPHMIDLHPGDNYSNLRKKLKIPYDSLVLGRHGGMDTFDFPGIDKAVLEIAKSGIHFVFMPKPYILRDVFHPNIHYLDVTWDKSEKVSFINMCDAMIHAQTLGETQGISVLEFVKLGKPVITYNGGRAQQHLKNLGENCIKYNNIEELRGLLLDHNGLKSRIKETSVADISRYSPKKIMERFRNIIDT